MSNLQTSATLLRYDIPQKGDGGILRGSGNSSQVRDSLMSGVVPGPGEEPRESESTESRPRMTLLPTAIGANREPTTKHTPSESAPQKDTPLSRAQEARPYGQAYFAMRELAKTQAHLMPMELWERICRVRDYCGWRYNSIIFAGREGAPGPWRSGMKGTGL